MMGDSTSPDGHEMDDLNLLYVQLLPSSQSRQRRGERFDKGVCKPGTGRSQGSEAEWAWNRKEAVVSAADLRRVATPQRRQELAVEDLPDSLAQEIKRQKSLASKRNALSLTKMDTCCLLNQPERSKPVQLSKSGVMPRMIWLDRRR